MFCVSFSASLSMCHTACESITSQYFFLLTFFLTFPSCSFYSSFFHSDSREADPVSFFALLEVSSSALSPTIFLLSLVSLRTIPMKVNPFLLYSTASRFCSFLLFHLLILCQGSLLVVLLGLSDVNPLVPPNSILHE